MDLIMKMPRLPNLGETVTNAEFLQTFGGKGANSAVGAARADGQVVFVNAVGDDPYAPALLSGMELDGIDVDLVWRETGISSGHALVMIGEGGANYLSVAPGANLRVTAERINTLEDQLSAAARILIQNEIPAEANRRVLDIAKRKGIPVQWNFAPCVETPLEWLRDASLLIVNESEARGLANQAGIPATGPAALAQSLLALCPAGVLITLGADGVEAATAEWIGHVPSFAVDAVDTTGAGDIFCGSLAVALVEGAALQEAIRFASAAAAISVGRLGAQPSAPQRAEIDIFIKTHHAH